MTTKFDIGQKVWIMWANEPVESEIVSIFIKEDIGYNFQGNNFKMRCYLI